jgi:dienelactone hydrolase
MKFTRIVSTALIVPILAFTLNVERAVAQGLPTIDRGSIYTNALDNYADASQQDAPTSTSIEKQTYTDCTMEKLTYKSENGQTVPALLFIPTTATVDKPVPCVILLHGLGGSKEQMAPVARALAPLGYASLAIDEASQGERATQGVGGADPAHLMSLIQKGVPQTAVDVRRGIDLLSTRKTIDSSRIGLIGVSLGAIIGTVAAGVEPRIKATVLISGGGNWGVILNAISSIGMLTGGQAARPLSQNDEMMATIGLAAEDPLTFAPHIAPRALLMEAGRLDNIIPPDSTQQLYDAASTPKNSNVHIDWYAQAGHVPDPSLTAPVVQKWLAAHL